MENKITASTTHRGFFNIRIILLAIPLLLTVSSGRAVEHPALPLSLSQSQLRALKTRLAPLMAISEEELLKLVPQQSGLYFVGCVNCTAGKREEQLLVWDWKMPDQVKCKFCGQVYPSDKYPVSSVTEVRAPNNSISRYPYYSSNPRWLSDKKPYRSYFQARIDYHKLLFMEILALDLARAYKLSGELVYARRAALILARFAQVYPGYCYRTDLPFQQKMIYDGNVAPNKFRVAYRTARWYWWAYSDISNLLLEAYDLIAASGELQKLSDEQKTDLPKQIEDMFTVMVEQVLGNKDKLTNMSPRMWADLIVAGRVLGKPQYVHIPFNRLRRMMTEMFFYDGSWQEGAPSYHSQVVDNVQDIVAVARGYSDPPGYKDTGTGGRFDNLDLEKQLPELARAKAALMRMRLPNGRYIPVHDTWSTHKGAVLEESKPDLLGGLGQGILGFGKGSSQLQVDMTWSPGYGHSHNDGLALLLFAKGRELLSDIGYTHTKYREWTVQTASHNLVVVNCANQIANKDTLGNLRYFAITPTIQVMSVDNPQVYPNLTSIYRRTVALVKLGETDAYVVDIFRVKGGKQHDYFLHGSSDEAQTLTVNSASCQFNPLPSLVPLSVKFTPPVKPSPFHSEPGQAYGYLSKLRQCQTSIDILLNMDFQDEKSSTGLQVFTLVTAGDQLVVGTNPSIRNAGSDDSKLDQYKRQFMMLRRQGDDSLFVSILAPYGEQRIVQGAKLVQMPGAAVALEVDAGQRKDLIVITDKPSKGQWMGNPVETDGELTIIETYDGELRSGTVVAGSFKCGGMSLKTPALKEAKLLGVERGKTTLLLDNGFVPTPNDVIVVDHGGKRCSPYTVKSAKLDGRQVRVEIAEDPGFEYNSSTQTSKFVFLPGESYQGKHVVRFYPVGQLSFKEEN